MIHVIDIDRIEASLDHTILRPDVSDRELVKFCSDAADSNAAALCIPPTKVSLANNILQGKKPICTVIGFPNGYHTTACKVVEATEAIENGATEIDVVINLGFVRDQAYNKLREEIRNIRKISSQVVLKVILETGALSRDACVQCIKALNDTGIDFYKTSTGFNFPGASLDMIRLIAENKQANIQMKASGGIRDLKTALAYLDAGATRIGSSGLLALCKEAKGEELHG